MVFMEFSLGVSAAFPPRSRRVRKHRDSHQSRNRVGRDQSRLYHNGARRQVSGL